jgi:RimJ/RimL family protein N-acetyltransferase
MDILIEPVVLEGTFVRLEPLALSHVEGLCAVGLDPDLWRVTMTLLKTEDDMRKYVQEALQGQRDGSTLPFAIVEKKSRTVVGSTRYGNIDRASRRLEIGWTWVARPWQRTAVNTECKYLLLRHAFERLGCMRVEFKTDVINEQSRRALGRIGAVEEGVLRRHMITPTGRVRDSVYFSILDTEWKGVKGNLERRLYS